MPRGDGTGPTGMGAMTGRAAGFCAGYGAPGYTNTAPGRGFGLGFERGRGAWNRDCGGGGRGRRNMFYATGLPGVIRFGGYSSPYGYRESNQDSDPEMVKQVLTNQAGYMQKELEAIQKRLSEIEKETDNK